MAKRADARNDVASGCRRYSSRGFHLPAAALSALPASRAGAQATEHLPSDHRDDPAWRHIAAQLEQAATGVEVVDLGIALRMALMLEGLEYQAQ